MKIQRVPLNINLDLKPIFGRYLFSLMVSLGTHNKKLRWFKKKLIISPYCRNKIVCRVALRIVNFFSSRLGKKFNVNC